MYLKKSNKIPISSILLNRNSDHLEKITRDFIKVPYGKTYFL